MCILLCVYYVHTMLMLSGCCLCPKDSFQETYNFHFKEMYICSIHHVHYIDENAWISEIFQIFSFTQHKTIISCTQHWMKHRIYLHDYRKFSLVVCQIHSLAFNDASEFLYWILFFSSARKLCWKRLLKNSKRDFRFIYKFILFSEYHFLGISFK